MNPLTAHLARRIAAEGPIGVDAYMADALGHPEHGYYRARDPLGRKGDFITAPEVSQMFGELIGLWCALVWTGIGRPERLRLVELGPGRGTLMADALRAAEIVEGFCPATHVHLAVTRPIAWHERFEEVPGGALVVIANEFLDALPIRQLQRTETGWCERLIGCDGERLGWQLSTPVASDFLPPALSNAPPGSIVEISPARDALVHAVAGRVAREGGAALFIDYGHRASAPGDTLQAVKDHRFHPVLESPGEADITAHVDFERVTSVACSAGARAHGPVSQGAFLRALGIETRALMLARTATPDEADEVRAALGRLTSPEEMGELFKVLAVTQSGAPLPAGFGG